MLKLRPIHVLVFVVALVLLGALAWGVGWAAHSLVGRPTTATPTGPLPVTPNVTPTVEPTQASTESAMSTPAPTSTPIPVPATSTAAPTAERKVETISVVTNDRGLNDVVRRACGLPRNYILASNNKIMQETRRINSFVMESPAIFSGQGIQVPIYLCP